jgi:DNA-binding response OmpR family regulator
MTSRLLLIDDDRTIRFAVSRYFVSKGYEIDCAGDEREARANLAAHTYDLVISDLRLSGLHATEGLDLLTDIRRDSPTTRTILLTAYRTPEIDEQASAAGADVILQKPRRLPELAQVVGALLEGRS